MATSGGRRDASRVGRAHERRQDTTADARFVTMCARELDDARSDELRAAASAVRDWDTVVDLATRHRVAGIVREAVATHSIAIPSSAERALEKANLFAVARTMAQDAELARLTSAMAAEGVPVIVLKGPVLSRTVYGIPALRPYEDIDLVVPETHECAAAAVLLRCGLTEVRCDAEEDRRLHAGHVEEGAAFHREFEGSGGWVAVELHTDALQLGLNPACEAGRWQRAVPAVDLPHALMLCPEDQLVYLAVHAHKHGFSRLIWLKDIDRFLRTYGSRLDWGLVEAVAGEEGARASVWYTLQLAVDMFGAPMPAIPFERLRPSVPLRALYRFVWPREEVMALQGRMRRRAVQFYGAESWRGVVPSLVLMGRRKYRVRALVRALFHR